jgi:hypothetical protein
MPEIRNFSYRQTFAKSVKSDKYTDLILKKLNKKEFRFLTRYCRSEDTKFSNSLKIFEFYTIKRKIPNGY